MRGAILLFSIFVMLGVQAAHAGATLAKVRSSRALTCGINTNEDDYSKNDTHGNLAALGADICKAVAAAVLGPGAKIVVTAYPDEPAGLAAVRSGKTALLAGATPDITYESAFGVGFGPPVFYDGQGFLVANAAGVASLKDFAGKQICFIGGTQAGDTLEAVFKERGIDYTPFPFEEMGEMEAALVVGHCAAITGDLSQLANIHALFHNRIPDFRIMADTIAKDPLAPAFRQGDPEWDRIVTWTVHALVQAEESGVTAANVDQMKTSADPEIRRLLGTYRGLGKALGLTDDWAAHAIAAVGNYGEIYERDVGQGSKLKLPRGLNALWTKGGLMYALPIR
jgi:general L-amino acid transport system substrate-binding protein